MTAPGAIAGWCRTGLAAAITAFIDDKTNFVMEAVKNSDQYKRHFFQNTTFRIRKVTTVAAATQLLDALQDELRETLIRHHGEEKGLQVVLKFDPTSDVLYGGATLDITQDVIKGLNTAYDEEKRVAAEKTPAKNASEKK